MSHFRYEWIYEVGTLSTISYTKVGRDGQEETGRTHAFYARHRHANGNIMEIVIAADAADALPPLVTRAAQMSAAANPSLRFDAAPSAAWGPGLLRWVRTPTRIDGAVPYSLPARF